MPATITPIQATRTYSVKPAQGLRYGNFDGVRNLPPLRDNESKKEKNTGLINNEQICRRVCQWMESWQPWQTRTLLCGIANRFTVSQLEILSTTLEPLRHRDYRTVTLSRYPSASLRDGKSVLQSMKRKPSNSKSDKSTYVKVRSTMPDKGIGVSSGRKVPYPRANNVELKEKKTNLDEQDADKHATPNIGIGGLLDNIDQFASKLSTSIMTSALHEFNRVLLFDKKQFSTSREPSYEKEVSKEHIGSVIQKESNFAKNGKRKISINEDMDNDFDAQDCSKSLTFDKMSFHKSQRSATSGRKSLLQSSRTSSARFLGGVLEFAIDPYHKACVRTRSTSSQYRYSTFGSSIVSTTDFFNKEKMCILGAMQKTVHPGPTPVSKSVGVDATPISLQKCYKHSRWWPAQAPQGKTYRHPQRRELANNFKEQLHTIWGWLNDWEGYERISFMKEVLKICSAEILDSLTNHIHQRMVHNHGRRLKDARDINRLPDQLLLYIFSFLPLHDILRSAKACRRWRYLCATDDLWILKCLEIGEDAGISNLPELIAQTKASGMQVDWMLAHFELNKLITTLELELTMDDVDRPPEQLLKCHRVWTGIIRPTAEDLSAAEKGKPDMDNEYKKTKGRIQFKTGLKEGLEQAEMSRVEGLDDEGSDADSTFSEEDLSHLMSEYIMMPKPSGSSGNPKWSKSLKRTEPFKLSVPEAVKEESTPGASSASRLTRSSKKFSATSSQKKNKEDDEKDIAMDIRTDLTQSHDILGKMKSHTSLEWETAETYNDYMRTTLFAGELIGVKRMRKLQGHVNAINCVYFDKRRLVTCGLDRIIRLWDVRSGRFLHEFHGHKGGVRCLQFDNDIMATGSWDCLVIIWDLKTFSQIATLQGHSDSVTCLQFNGDLLITGSDDRSIRFWRRPTFYCMLTLQFDAPVRSLIIVDHLFIVSTANLTTEMIDVYTGARRRKFEAPLSPIQCLTAHGQLLIGGDEFGRVCFWNLSSGEMEAAVKVHDACVNQVAYHGGRFFTASDDTTIKEWDLRTMTCLRVLKGHRGPVRDVKVSDRRIVSCSDDTTVRIWDLVLDKTKVVDTAKAPGKAKK